MSKKKGHHNRSKEERARRCLDLEDSKGYSGTFRWNKTKVRFGGNLCELWIAGVWSSQLVYISRMLSVSQGPCPSLSHVSLHLSLRLQLFPPLPLPRPHLSKLLCAVRDWKTYLQLRCPYKGGGCMICLNLP